MYIVSGGLILHYHHLSNYNMNIFFGLDRLKEINI